MFNTAGVGVNFLEIFNRQSILLAENVQLNQPEGVAFDMWPYIFRMSLQTIYGEYASAGIRYFSSKCRCRYSLSNASLKMLFLIQIAHFSHLSNILPAKL